MTPTSTDLRARSTARFTRALIALIVVLSIACATFFTLGVLQGPKLTGAQVDARAVIEQPGQQLRLFANQPLTGVDNAHVTVTPDVAHSVRTTGNTIAVQFEARLDYNTRYTVDVGGVSGVYQSQSSTLSYSFTTASAPVYYLSRGTPTDQILSSSVDGTDRTVVYSAPSIQSFTVAPNVLAVVTLGADNTSALDLVSLTDGAVEHVPLPEPGVIEKLAASASGTLLGFTFTSAGDSITPKYSATLMTIDLESASAPTPVLGLTGTSLTLLDWRFMPTGAQLVALTLDRTLFLIDPTTAGSVLPLGQFTGIGSVSIDGSTVLVTDPFGAATLAFGDGSQARVTPSPVSGLSGPTYLGDLVGVSATTRVEKLLVGLPGGKRFATVVARDDGSASQVLFRTLDDAGSIQGFTVSPNGQYVAVEVVPSLAAGVSDGYHFDAKDRTTETVIVEVATGTTVRTLSGFGLIW